MKSRPWIPLLAIILIAGISTSVAGATAHAVEPFYDSAYEPSMIAAVDGGTFNGIAVTPVADATGAPSWYRADVTLGGEAAGRLPIVPKVLQDNGCTPIVQGTGIDCGLKIARTIDTLWEHFACNATCAGSAVTDSVISANGWCVFGSTVSPLSSPCGNGIGAITSVAVTSHDLGLEMYSAPGVVDCHGTTHNALTGGVFIDPSGLSGTPSTCEARIRTMLINASTDAGAFPGAPTGVALADKCLGTGLSVTHPLGIGRCAIRSIPGATCTAVINQWLGATFGDGTTTYSGTCYSVVLPEKGFLEATLQAPWAKWTTQTAPAVATFTMSPAPTQATSSANINLMRNKMDSTTGSGASVATPAEFDCLVAPSDYGPPANEYTSYPGGNVAGTNQASCAVPGGSGGTTDPTCTNGAGFPAQLPIPAEGETPSEYSSDITAKFPCWTGNLDPIGATAYEAALLTAGTCSVSCDYLDQPDNTVIGAVLHLGTPAYIFDTNGKFAPPTMMASLASRTGDVDVYVKPDPSDFEPGTSVSAYGKIDWTPLTGISFNDHFPWGVPAWVSNSIEGAYANTGSHDSCPGLPLPYATSISNGTSTGVHPFVFPICSNVATESNAGSDWSLTYKPWVFPLMEALMTLAGIMWLGTKILGTSGSEQPE